MELYWMTITNRLVNKNNVVDKIIKSPKFLIPNKFTSAWLINMSLKIPKVNSYIVLAFKSRLIHCVFTINGNLAFAANITCIINRKTIKLVYLLPSVLFEHENIDSSRQIHKRFKKKLCLHIIVEFFSLHWLL